MNDPEGGARIRRWRAARTWLIYRADRVLEWPPLAQVLLVGALTTLVVIAFAGLAVVLDAGPRDASFGEEIWWSLTHFADGGAMAADPSGRRVAGALVTASGILVMSLLTAALTSKMGERIGEMRGGLLPVVEHDHVLVLGYAPNTPLLVRELARSGQEATVVVLAVEDKARVELSLRTARAVPGQRLSTIVRTGDPRYELALVRVAAEHARAIVVIPPSLSSDEESVRWTLAALLSLHRVLPDGWSGQVLVEARHEEARELLELATEPGIAGSGAVPMRVVATDRVIAQILAQGARQDGLYFVLRHLLAFDGCELYCDPVPPDLVGRTFDEAHARADGVIPVGLMRDGRPTLTPSGALGLEARDRLIVVADGRGRERWNGSLPVASPRAMTEPARNPERVVVLGQNATLPHLLRELAGSLPSGSHVEVLTDRAEPFAARAVAELAPSDRAVTVTQAVEPLAPLARRGSDKLCAADAIVILGEQGADDVNGDASALAMLLRLRKAIRDWTGVVPGRTSASGVRSARLVTEVRDPRSAVHVEPRPGDAVVSSDVVAMLLAQGVLDPASFPVYAELLSGERARVVLRSRSRYAQGPATFAEVMAAARAAGEVALGMYPDPRPHPPRAALDRQRLEEGDTSVGEEAWLNPPRGTSVPDDGTVQVVVIARVGSSSTPAVPV